MYTIVCNVQGRQQFYMSRLRVAEIVNFGSTALIFLDSGSCRGSGDVNRDVIPAIEHVAFQVPVHVLWLNITSGIRCADNQFTGGR